MICSTCGAPAEWGCTREVERYVPTRVRDLRLGAHVCRNDELRPKNNSFATVVMVERGTILYRVHIAIHRPGRPDRRKDFLAPPENLMRRAAMVPCGALLCENCAQNPGDPHRYCPEHWTIRSLERAA